jgi:cobalt-zinc-cadmium efflux system protein
VPEGVEASHVSSKLEAEIVDVREVHHVHLWQLGGGQRMATLHARLHEGGDPDRAIDSIQEALRAHFGVSHATVQIEASACRQSRCASAPECHQT